MRLEIVPLNYKQQQQEVKEETESIQRLMKNLELGINSLQENILNNVVKTAAETAAQVYCSISPSHSQKQQFDVICDGCYSPIRG